MKEPTRYSLSTGLPEKKETVKIPMPSLYPEKMSDDVYAKEESAEASFLKFIADQEESRKKYKERLQKISNKEKESN